MIALPTPIQPFFVTLFILPPPYRLNPTGKYHSPIARLKALLNTSVFLTSPE
jgi:hypothetical protein